MKAEYDYNQDPKMKMKEEQILETDYTELINGEQYILAKTEKGMRKPSLFDLPTYQDLLDLIRSAKLRKKQNQQKQEEDMKKL